MRVGFVVTGFFVGIFLSGRFSYWSYWSCLLFNTGEQGKFFAILTVEGEFPEAWP